MTRISSALQSSDLTHKDRPCDSDTVRALGLVAIHRPLGVLVMEALESCAGDSRHDARRVRDLIEAVSEVAKKQAQRDRIKIQAHKVAEVMVKELIYPCARCGGRGFLPLTYGPEASDELRGEECPTCGGSGRARRDFRARGEATGHDHYSIAVKRFYEALETRLNEAEWTSRFYFFMKFGLIKQERLRDMRGN